MSANEKNFSNTTEFLTLLDKIIIPYVTSKHKRKELDINYPALFLMDIFRGQMTDPILLELQENSILLVQVSPNMTNLFQSLDLTVNGAAKAFLKRKYTEWYSGEISKALVDGIVLDGTEIKLKLSVLKPLQDKWIVELYSYLTSEKGHDVIGNGWISAGITGTIECLVNLESLNLFAAIDPLEHGSTVPMIENRNLDQFDIPSFVTYYSNDDDDDEWDIEGNPIRNIFEIIDDVV